MPIGWYLECTIAGTTSNEDITLTSTIGSIVSDGTVVWIVSKNFPSTGGIFHGRFIYRDVNTSDLEIFGGNNVSNGASLCLYGKDSQLQGAFNLRANNSVAAAALVGFYDGTLTWGGNDLAGAVIRKKSFDINGYIMYANGLILQWGYASIDVPTTNSDTILPINLPINFSNAYKVSLLPITGSPNGRLLSCNSNTLSQIKVVYNSLWATPFGLQWFAIGY